MDKDYTQKQLEHDKQFLLDAVARAMAVARGSHAPDHVDYANSRSLIANVLHEALKQPR